jgi:serine/threonine protein kinase/Tfp pilus assembly protein PilF
MATGRSLPDIPPVCRKIRRQQPKSADEVQQRLQAISYYQILKKLGEGGMGEVYLAQDTRLNRTVVLKILPVSVALDRERIRRFKKEARTAASLTHPNVAHVYEIGEVDGTSFIAMEYVEGQALDLKIKGQPLETNRIIQIGMETADALEEAHSKGITHRDIKPSNIMITTRGQVKVLDFGVAKISKPVEQTANDNSTDVKTSLGIILGTVPYMSPEQAHGQEVDHRSDIFSLGVVMYEMATGRLPFFGSNKVETIERITRSQPEAIARFNYNIPEELERIIRKSLEKDRERRYQSSRELLIDLKNLHRDSGAAVTKAKTVMPQPRVSLRSLSLTALALLIFAAVLTGIYLLSERGEAINSVAVLPFVNVSADPNTEYLTDGITESLINNLSQLGNLKVIARSSVFRYKRREIEPQAVGRELGVNAVLTGRVIQRGDDLSISIELMDARDNSHIWGEQYSRKLADTMMVQSEISREVTERLRRRLSGEEQKQLAKRHTEETEAYQLYLKGRYHFHKLTLDDVEKGIEYFRQAIEKDPNYGLAHTGLADCYNYLGKPIEAKAAITSAIEVDDTLGEAHASLAFIKFLHDWDWAGAERHFKRGVELNPNYALAHHWYAIYLANMGRHDEAIREAKRAQELDPLTLVVSMTPAATLYLARRYDLAIEELQKGLDMDANFVPSHSLLGVAYEQKGMYEKAIVEYQKVIDHSGGNPHAEVAMKARIGHAYALWDKRAEAVKILDVLLKRRDVAHSMMSYSIAEIYVGLGENDRAFEWLERAREERNIQMVSLKVDPNLDGLRSDPRFSGLLRRMNLPE